MSYNFFSFFLRSKYFYSSLLNPANSSHNSQSLGNAFNSPKMVSRESCGNYDNAGQGAARVGYDGCDGSAEPLKPQVCFHQVWSEKSAGCNMKGGLDNGW